jgi:hypothetical protein
VDGPVSRSLIGVYDLVERQTKNLVNCELYDEIAPHNAAHFVTAWKPLFDEKKAKLGSSGQLTDGAFKEFSLQDAHWEWPAKAAAVSSSSMLHGFALEAQGMTQGLMIVVPFGVAREESQRGLPITEVMLLSTAPWNRHKLVDAPIYKGVGRILLSAAISLSMEEEHNGRIGLHALSGAEDWYRDVCGMTDLGYDTNKKMQYFEMTEAQAKRFIS